MERSDYLMTSLSDDQRKFMVTKRRTQRKQISSAITSIADSCSAKQCVAESIRLGPDANVDCRQGSATLVPMRPRLPKARQQTAAGGGGSAARIHCRPEL